jgi:signal transduction histidine kinase
MGIGESFVLAAYLEDHVSAEMQNMFAGIGKAAEMANNGVKPLKGMGEETNKLSDSSRKLVSVMGLLGPEMGKLSSGAYRVTNAFSSIARDGFNPFTIAIAGVSLGIGAIIALMPDAITDTERHTKAMREYAAAAEASAAALESATYALAGYNEAQKNIYQNTARLEDVQRRLAIAEEAQANEDPFALERIKERGERIANLKEEMETLTTAVKNYTAAEVARDQAERNTLAGKNAMDFLSKGMGNIGGGPGGPKLEDKLSGAPSLLKIKNKGGDTLEGVAESIAQFEEGQKYATQLLAEGTDKRLAIEDAAYAKKIGMALSLEEQMSRIQQEAQQQRLQDLIDYYGKDLGEAMAANEKKIEQIEQANIKMKLANEMFSEMGQIAAKGSKLALAMEVGQIVTRTAVRAMEEYGLAVATSLTNPAESATHLAGAIMLSAIGAAQVVKAAMGGSGGGGVSSAGRGGGGGRSYVQENPAEREPSRYTIAIYGPAWFGQDADKAIYETVKNYESSQRPGAVSEGF